MLSASLDVIGFNMLPKGSKSSEISEKVTPYSEEFEEATLKLPPQVLEYLRKAAKKRGVSTGDMVRIALGTYKFLGEQAETGASVVVHDKDKLTRVAI
jgi:hypothetical protein